MSHRILSFLIVMCDGDRCAFGLQVLYGKVKKIAPNLTWKKSQDPVVGFDCHMSKDVVSPRDTPHQQVLGSSVSCYHLIIFYSAESELQIEFTHAVCFQVFLFDFNEYQELNERPRQCLPYAVVSFVPASSVILTTPLNIPFSPTSQGKITRKPEVLCTIT